MMFFNKLLSLWVSDSFTMIAAISYNGHVNRVCERFYIRGPITPGYIHQDTRQEITHVRNLGSTRTPRGYLLRKHWRTTGRTGRYSATAAKSGGIMRCRTYLARYPRYDTT